MTSDLPTELSRCNTHHLKTGPTRTMHFNLLQWLSILTRNSYFKFVSLKVAALQPTRSTVPTQ